MNLYIALLFFVASTFGAENSTDDLLKKGNDQFTARLFTEVVKENANGSVVFSAFAVLTPLGQLLLASEAETHDELLKTIGLPSDNATVDAFLNLNKKLRSKKDIELKMVNRIYLKNNLDLNEAFVAETRDVFEADIKKLDFGKNVEAAEEINKWADEQTNHCIKNIVNPDSFDGDTVAILINAIYFKGEWEHNFKKLNTFKRTFYVNAAKNATIPFMTRTGLHKYAESEDLKAKILELDYKGGDTSFVVILPNEVEGLAALEDKIKDPLVLNKALDKLDHTFVAVHLPKFKIETKLDLKKLLKKMDVQSMFQADKARFSKLLKDGSKPVYVSEAAQKAFIQVDELGTEAAAVTEFELEHRSAFIVETSFRADHPFVFLIRSGGMILFSGVFQN